MSELQKYHCVTQLRNDSWEYRVKGDHEEPNEDDLVSMDDYLRLHDQLRLEYQAHDKRQVETIEHLRLAAAEQREQLDKFIIERGEMAGRLANEMEARDKAQAERDEARAKLAGVRDWLRLCPAPYTSVSMLQELLDAPTRPA